MLRRLGRLSDWPFLLKLGVGPGLALAALAALAWLGVDRIGLQSNTIDALLRDKAAGALLQQARTGLLDINGRMFRVLALQAAQTAGLKAVDELQALTVSVDGVTKTLLLFRDQYATEARKAEIDALSAGIAKYKAAVDWVSQMLEVDFSSAVSFLQPFDAVFAATSQQLTAMQAEFDARSLEATNAAADAADAARTTFPLASGSAAALVLLLSALIATSTTRSILRIAVATESLAQGNVDTDTHHLARRDELGAIVRSLEVFRDGLLSVRELRTEQDAGRERAASEKQAALVRMADTIESEATKALGHVTARSSAMAETADEMHESAARTGACAQGASAAAAEALANAQMVACSAEQLSSSIREISGQVAHSTSVVGRAVEAGSETRATIVALNEQVTRIGAVADMIKEIAARTNLLALNATIEAARAGEAGRGFAVVAGEVKLLATQTAHSTEEIAQRIAEVRTATDASVAAVGRIEQTIAEISCIAGSIAAAVEEQGAATAEIARNVTRTAAASNEMKSRISEVSAEAEATDQRATEVKTNTAALAEAVGDLRRAVVRAVRTSTAEVDRRSGPRLAIDMPCRVTGGKPGEHPCRLVDLSEGGACISGGPTLAPGARGSLVVDAVGTPLPFTVRDAEGGLLRVAFELNDAAVQRLRPVLDRIGEKRAA